MSAQEETREMKLILTQEVDGLGAAGDVVEVKDGYGRNFLMPRGVAIRWTRGGERQAESIKLARSSRAVRDHDHAEEIKTKLEAEQVDVKVRAGSGRSPVRRRHRHRDRRGAGRGLRRAGRQAADHGRPADQVARRPHGLGQAARRRVRRRGAQRHPRLTHAPSTTAGPFGAGRSSRLPPGGLSSTTGAPAQTRPEYWNISQTRRCTRSVRRGSRGRRARRCSPPNTSTGSTATTLIAVAISIRSQPRRAGRRRRSRPWRAPGRAGRRSRTAAGRPPRPATGRRPRARR